MHLHKRNSPMRTLTHPPASTHNLSGVIQYFRDHIFSPLHPKKPDIDLEIERKRFNEHKSRRSSCQHVSPSSLEDEDILLAHPLATRFAYCPPQLARHRNFQHLNPESELALEKLRMKNRRLRRNCLDWVARIPGPNFLEGGFDEDAEEVAVGKGSFWGRVR
jgi:hypothetical protein